MSYESIKNEFESNSRVKFKLYSLEYLIERVDNYVQVYAIDYPTRKSKYNTVEELFNNFTVFHFIFTIIVIIRFTFKITSCINTYPIMGYNQYIFIFITSC